MDRFNSSRRNANTKIMRVSSVAKSIHGTALPQHNSLTSKIRHLRLFLHFILNEVLIIRKSAIHPTSDL